MDVTSLIIRPVIESDLPHLLWSDEMKELQEFDRENFEKAKSGYFFFYVAEVDKEDLSAGRQVVGRIRIIPYAIDGNGWIAGLHVKPTMRNHGIGSALLRKAEYLLHLFGKPEAYLSVEIKNTNALRLYQNLGYTIYNQGKQTWSYPKNGKKVAVMEELYYMKKEL